jgi:hypothetical protein
MTEPTYGGLTAAQLWQAIAEAGAAEMSIKPLVLAALLRELERLQDRREMAIYPLA